MQKVVLDAALDRAADLRAPSLFRERGEGSEGLPAVERPGRGIEAVSAAIGLLGAEEPVDEPVKSGVGGVP